MEEQVRNESTHPEENGGRTFTQDDVNRIVQDRLAQERARAEKPTERETSIAAREARLDCREFITDKGFPAALMDIFDTSDAGRFKEAAERLIKTFPRILEKPEPVPAKGWGTHQSGSPISNEAEIAAAFKPRK